jgi:hypothetical protein
LEQADFRHSKRKEARLIMAFPHDIGTARLRMLDVRKALEDHARLKGVASTCEHMKLTQAFAKATRAYLRLSSSQQ